MLLSRLAVTSIGGALVEWSVQRTATADIAARCFRITALARPVRQSHSRAVWSREPLTMSEAALSTSNDVIQSVCPRSVEVSARRSRRSHIRQLWSDDPVIRRWGPPPFDITTTDDAWALCGWEWNGVNATRAACSVACVKEECIYNVSLRCGFIVLFLSESPKGYAYQLAIHRHVMGIKNKDARQAYRHKEAWLCSEQTGTFVDEHHNVSRRS
jgi:hypothetical protein